MTAAISASMPAPAMPVTRLPLLLTAIAITAANFMNVLDLTIAVVAVPSISGTLGASPSQGAWILTSYAICLAVILPLSPWVCKRYGEVRVFSLSVVMFALTSMACGMSRHMETLVFFRALQGLSSGFIVPLSQTLLLRIFPPHKHGSAIGLWSIVSTIAPVLGYTATLSGLVMAGTSVLPIIGMMLVGKNIAKLNLRYLVVSGSLVTMLAIYLQAQSTTDTTFAQMLQARVVMGIGFTLMFPPLMVISLGSVSADRTVGAASFFNFFRNIATSVGIAAGMSLWQSRTAFHRLRLVEELNPDAPGKELAFAPIQQLVDGSPDALWAVVDKLATAQASTMGISDTFMICMIAVIPVILLSPFIPARLAPRPGTQVAAGE